MAFNKALKDEIDAMGVGDLVHFMLATFDRDYGRYGDEIQGPWMQPEGYSWAHERLNQIIPAEISEEDTAAGLVASDATPDRFPK